MIACDRNNTKEYNKANIKEDDKANTKEISGTNTKNELFIVAGGHNTAPKVCEYYLYNIDVTTRIKPSIITANSSYYDVETDGNIYIDVTLCINSLSNESNLEKHASIKPLETRKFHYISEVSTTDSTGESEIILTINGKNFSNKFHLEGVIS